MGLIQAKMRAVFLGFAVLLAVAACSDERETAAGPGQHAGSHAHVGGDGWLRG